MQKTCIIVPCYNEASRLDPAAFLSFALTHPHIFFLFIDDGSQDDSYKILQALHRSNKTQFMVHSRKENLGKGASIREGIPLAIQWEHFAYIGYLDADLSTPLSELPSMLSAIEKNPEVEIVFGSRKKKPGNLIRRSLIRHIFGRLYTIFLTSTLHLDIYDTQCGAKIIRCEAAKKIFSQPFIDRWLFDVEIFCRIRELFPGNSPKYLEIVLGEWVEKGNSRIKPIDILKLPSQTIKLLLRYR